MGFIEDAVEFHRRLKSGELVAVPAAELAALRKQIELLTAERDGARAERNHYMQPRAR